jgi:hypothetical protein
MPRRIGHVREPTEEVRSVDVTKRVELLERAQDVKRRCRTGVLTGRRP